jgi:hypothetical protein
MTYMPPKQLLEYRFVKPAARVRLPSGSPRQVNNLCPAAAGYTVCLLLADGRNIGYMPEVHAVDLAPLIDSGARHEVEVKKILNGQLGLIPAIWGDFFAAESASGGTSPVVSSSPAADGRYLV